MKTNMTQLDLQKVREFLEEERAQLLEQMMGSGDDDGRPVHMNPDRDDLAQDYISLEQEAALLAIEQEQLAKIEDALQRLDDGTYGICLDCREPIPPERLEALPYATLCVRCQSRQERKW